LTMHEQMRDRFFVNERDIFPLTPDDEKTFLH